MSSPTPRLPDPGQPDTPGPSKTLRDYLASVVRTVVPIGVGIALTWFGVKVGIPIPEGVRWVVVGGVMAGYHALVRAAETRWRGVGWLLGLAVTPVYPTDPKDSGATRSETVTTAAGSAVVSPPDTGINGFMKLHIRGDGVEGWVNVARRHIVRSGPFHRGRHTPWALGR